MAKWKGKNVTRKRFFDLKQNVIWRRICERSKYGFFYEKHHIVIGGKKNSKVNHINVY
jgi:predicted nucleic-acid-binding Zn-ribbon protein